MANPIVIPNKSVVADLTPAFEFLEGWLFGTATEDETQDLSIQNLQSRVGVLEGAGYHNVGIQVGPTYGASGTVLTQFSMTTHGNPVLLISPGYIVHNGVGGTTYTIMLGHYVDGVAVGGQIGWTHNTSAWRSPANCVNLITGLSAVAHTFSYRIVSVNATPALGLYNWDLIAIELPFPVA